jgi:Lysylphosphatidylglycerol synthase TM region
LVVGVAALVWMVFHVGPDTLLAGMKAVGWGFVLTCGAHLTGLMLDSVVLRACAGAPGRKVPFLHFARTSVAGHAVNEATPFGKVGEVVKYALLDERLRKADSAGALVAANIASFVVNCCLIASVAPVAVLALDAKPLVEIGFAVVGVGFLGAAAVGLVILRRGLGGWPFAVLRRVGVGRFRLSKKRLERWQRSWSKVEKAWKEATTEPGAMVTIWVGTVLSRLANVLEAGLLLYFLGIESDMIVAGAFLNLAGYQFTAWVFTFVPLQAGSAEGAAFLLFRAVGLPPQIGVMVEIGRKVRRLVFICLGVVVLGWDTFRRLASGDGEKPADDEAPG